MKKCPDCGMVIANQAIRCPKCKFDFSANGGFAEASGQTVAAGTPAVAQAPVSGKSVESMGILPMTEVTADNVDELYATLKLKIDKRKTEFDHFIDFLENRTSWLTAPADTEGPLAIEKGLLIRSVGVALQLLRIKDTLMPQLDEESAVIIGLFHDVGKVGIEGKPLYIVEESAPLSSSSALGLSFSSRLSTEAKKSYSVNSKLVHLPVGVRSLYLVGQYMLLSDDEAQALSFASAPEALDGKIGPYTLVLRTAIDMQKDIYENADVLANYSFTVVEPKK